MKNRLFAVSKKLRTAISIVFAVFISAIILLSLFFALREIWLWAFFPEDLPISAKITDFSWIEFETQNKCQGASGNNPLGFPLEVNLVGVSGGVAQIYQIHSETPFRFRFEFNQSTYKISSTINGKSAAPVNGTATTDYFSLSGTANSINIDLSKVKVLTMSEYLCAPKINLLHYSPNFYLADIDSYTKGNGAVKTSQTILGDESVVVTLQGQVFLDDQPNKMLDKIEIAVDGNKSELPELITSIEGDSLDTELPHFIADSFNVYNSLMTPRGSFSFERYFVEAVRIGTPDGQVQFGSFSPIVLDNTLNKSSFVELELPKSPVKMWNEQEGFYFLDGDLDKNTLTINGTTSRVIYRKQEYGLSNWQKLPGYAQGGIFTLLLGLITGTIEIVRSNIQKRRTTKTIHRYEPPKGSFVCVTDSGYLICGALISKPGFWFPYFILSNVRRKHKDEDVWEEKAIAQIQIKASRIEQTYFIE